MLEEVSLQLHVMKICCERLKNYNCDENVWRHGRYLCKWYERVDNCVDGR